MGWCRLEVWEQGEERELEELGEELGEEVDGRAEIGRAHV
mgnify:CR=1 FL=1